MGMSGWGEWVVDPFLDMGAQLVIARFVEEERKEGPASGTDAVRESCEFGGVFVFGEGWLTLDYRKVEVLNGGGREQYVAVPVKGEESAEEG